MFKNFLKNAVEHAKRFAPAALTPEKRFAKALISVSALMTMADGKADDAEVEAVSQVIFNHRSIKEYLAPSDAHDMFALQTQKLQEASSGGSVKFTLEVNAVIAEIADSVKERHWRQEVLETAKLIAESSGGIGQEERAVLNKLQTALA